MAVFATWMILGLFLDGWSHGANKPESFFTPWHALLYSGFVAAVAWFAWDGWRQSSTGAGEAVPGDRWLTAGLALFVTGAVGDGVWHEVFGVEVDLEALLSPTHLLLFIGGFLMASLPLRLADADVDEVTPTWATWWPQAITLTLLTALVGFFTMYLSAFEPVGGFGQRTELGQVAGIASVLVTNLLFVVPALFVLRRWDPPIGTFVLHFGVAALLMTGLDGFDAIALVIPALAAGMVLELVRLRTADLLVIAGSTSLALWIAYFAVADAAFGIVWTIELWAGAIVLATACSVLLAALGEGARARR